MRLITEYQSEVYQETTTSGLAPITIGFKTNFCNEKGIIPATSLIAHITTSALGSSAFHTSHLAPSFRFTMQHTLSENASLSYNLGAEWDGETTEPTYLYTLTTGISLSEKLGMYLEAFGYFIQNEKADHRFDAGFTYLLSNDMMIDLSGGVRITDNAPKNYLSLGFSYRFNIQKSQ